MKRCKTTNTNMKKTVVIVFALLFAMVTYTFAQEPAIVTSDKPGWHKIGEVKADFKMDSESIAVLGKDQFKAIKLKVTDATMDIEKVTVFFESGSTQEIPVHGAIKAGVETGEYKLQNPTEEIKKVTFTYKSLPNAKDEKAHVELYGLK
jgi:hypothetical protein